MQRYLLPAGSVKCLVHPTRKTNGRAFGQTCFHCHAHSLIPGTDAWPTTAGSCIHAAVSRLHSAQAHRTMSSLTGPYLSHCHLQLLFLLRYLPRLMAAQPSEYALRVSNSHQPYHAMAQDWFDHSGLLRKHICRMGCTRMDIDTSRRYPS